MINTIIIALILCMIEFLVIVIASPMAKPSLVLRFLPKDIREAAIMYSGLTRHVNFVRHSDLSDGDACFDEIFRK